MSNSFKKCPTHFSRGANNFAGEASPPAPPADDQEEMNNFYRQNKLVQSHWSLCTDGAPVLREVRFYNSSEQTGTARHFYSLCSSSICTCRLSLSRILENSFETRSWTCEFCQGTGVSFQLVF